MHHLHSPLTLLPQHVRMHFMYIKRRSTERHPGARKTLLRCIRHPWHQQPVHSLYSPLVLLSVTARSIMQFRSGYVRLRSMLRYERCIASLALLTRSLFKFPPTLLPQHVLPRLIPSIHPLPVESYPPASWPSTLDSGAIRSIPLESRALSTSSFRSPSSHSSPFANLGAHLSAHAA